MQSEIRQWIAESRKKLEEKGLDNGDLEQLEGLIENQRPSRIMYLTARSINMRSGIVGWAVFVPGEGPEFKLPGDEPPYESVLDAVADGWRVVQYPINKLYEYKDLENDYVGFDFILEK
ncbi:MAG: hypothetical protein OXO51_08085 [Gemmatimonadota bacterium]|nr:hypothetical protein [Gemmatimonadota bacterium]